MLATIVSQNVKGGEAGKDGGRLETPGGGRARVFNAAGQSKHCARFTAEFRGGSSVKRFTS